MINDLAGKTFGRLTVIGRTQQTSKSRQIRWLCRCICGVEKSVSSGHLKRGTVRSCGCLSREAPHHMTHGHFRGKKQSGEYIAWAQAKARCNNPKNPAFNNYGGRGISICKEWAESFEQFLADMGPRPHGMSIDRIDNNGNYEPSNCRWATRIIQANNRRGNILFEWNGAQMSLAEIARYERVNYKALFHKVRKDGLSLESAISYLSTRKRLR